VCEKTTDNTLYLADADERTKPVTLTIQQAFVKFKICT
jgi:hypothetical protein